MEPTHIRFGGGASDTILHPLVAVALLVAICLIFSLPRRRVIIPWLSIVFLVPFGQVLVIGGVHFTVYRILVISGLVRLATIKLPRGEGRFVGGFSSVDRAFTMCALFTFTTFVLQWMESQALIKGLGNLLDALGGYFVLRFLIRDKQDIQTALKVFASIAVILAVSMSYEQVSHKNVFGFLGGMPVEVTMRDGKPRSQGSFEVYITAGVFGATLLPLFLSLWRDAKAITIGLVGVVAAIVMTATSNSSTPLLAFAAAIVGIAFWPIRKNMRAVRWGLVLMVVGLHLSMKAPVWALIERIDLTGSSSGFHRYMLVDQCIKHFSDWWLIGTKDYNDWGFDMWDLSDQYVASAVTGGLATLVAFILVISRSFGGLGTARRVVQGDRRHERFLWCLCAALFSQVVGIFGIGFFDQLQVQWYALLAIIVAAVSEAVPSRASRVQDPLELSEAESGKNWEHAGADPVRLNLPGVPSASYKFLKLSGFANV